MGPHFLGLPNRSEICPKIDPKIDVILVSFWVSLGSLLASLLGPLGRPNRSKFDPRGPKIAPRRPRKASRLAKMIIFIPNLDLSKNIEKLMNINVFGSPSRLQIAPRWPQARSRWPKIGPRRPQDAPKTVLKVIFSLLKIDFDFDLFSDRFWLHFGS